MKSLYLLHKAMWIKGPSMEKHEELHAERGRVMAREGGCVVAIFFFQIILNDRVA